MHQSSCLSHSTDIIKITDKECNITRFIRLVILRILTKCQTQTGQYGHIVSFNN